MSRPITEYALFKPRMTRPETKADITDHAARVITGDEAARRQAKTARLRRARLENEAKLAAASSPPKLRPKKAASTRRARSSA
jgi:hypothetical protein